MQILGFLVLLAPPLLAAGSTVSDARAAGAARDFATGERLITEYRVQNGITPELLEALSWLGRGALAAKDYDKADGYAAETRKLALDALKTRALDAEKHLPLALGASIEVQAHVMSGHGERAEAVRFLRRELKTYYDTSIRTRIQKNINLLSLEGKPAPALEIGQWLGSMPLPASALKGRPVLLFFWAHWCGDCKRQGPVLAKIMQSYGGEGLVVMGPTQRYGYAERGQDATPEQELKYIERIRQQFYGNLQDMAVPVSEENFRNYGASTTPTLVLADRDGIVRLYPPGNLSSEELDAQVRKVMGK